MTSTLVDTNILIDLFGTGPLFEASANALIAEAGRGAIVISPIVWAELATPGVAETLLWRRLAWLKPTREPLPFDAAYPSGLAHRAYRQRGDARERTLPDFLIGAHALVAGHRLLTRDGARYRTAFPDLDIVSPEVLS